MSRYYGKPYYKVYRLYQEPTDWFFVKNESNSDSDLYISFMNNTPSSHPQYSLDGLNWTYFSEYNNITIPAGDKLFLRSKDGLNEYDKYWCIQPQMNISIGGNLSRLVNWQDNNVSVFPDYFFKQFLSQNTSYIIGASELTTGNVQVAGNCSFEYAFYNTNITSLGDFSSLTTLQYGAFSYAFQSSSNLTTGIDLSNVTSIGESSMVQMYSSCSNLSDVTAPNLSEWNEYAVEGWLNGAGSSVSGTKTAHVPEGVIIPEGYYGIPSGWTRVTY